MNIICVNTISKGKESASLYITEEQYKEFKGNMILGKGGIIPKLLEQLFTDTTFYEYVKKLRDKKIEILYIEYSPNGSTGHSWKLNDFSRTKLAHQMNTAVAEGLVNLNKEAQSRFLDYYNQIYYTNSDLVDPNQKIQYAIEGKKIDFSIKLFMDVLLMKEEDYQSFFDIKKEPYINEIPKKYFLYALKKFFQENNILDTYRFPAEVIDRFYEIILYEKLDFQAVNESPFLVDQIVYHVNINDALKEAVLQDMKEEWNPLQKAIFIYIKLCKLLTYDEVYYAYGQKGKGAEKHKSVDQVANITPKNNGSVCYEFNAIFEKGLYDVDIPFETVYFGASFYGNGHNYVIFYYDKYIVKADSTNKNDLIHAKRNEPLEGLICKNLNKHTKEEFQNMVDEIYAYIIQKEIEHGCNQSAYAFQNVPIALQEEMLLMEFQKIVGKQSLSLEDKVKCFLLKVQENNIDGFDGFKYILLLKKLLFGPMMTSYVIFNNTSNEQHPLNAIFAFNPYGVEENEEENQYYYFPRPNKVIPISREEIEQHFEDGEWDYIFDMPKRIPGITLSYRM